MKLEQFHFSLNCVFMDFYCIKLNRKIDFCYKTHKVHNGNRHKINKKTNENNKHTDVNY